MSSADGDRPGGPSSPPGPQPISPKPKAMDPATASVLASVWRRAMDRAGLTIADLRAPDAEHVRAA
ncbi:hypothetical protein AB0B28_08325 [Glycomyces sp. NPDC046736]|uniref:hypothetical protein n=1 Tax=Glycomyces sp. NPDC046736 TaxID=3155615 RepID=UPI0033C289FB